MTATVARGLAPPGPPPPPPERSPAKHAAAAARAKARARVRRSLDDRDDLHATAADDALVRVGPEVTLNVYDVRPNDAAAADTIYKFNRVSSTIFSVGVFHAGVVIGGGPGASGRSLEEGATEYRRVRRRAFVVDRAGARRASFLLAGSAPAPRSSRSATPRVGTGRRSAVKQKNCYRARWKVMTGRPKCSNER